MVGKVLKEKIKEKRCKQINLAQHLRISPSRLSNYLSDKREPDFQILVKICKYLGITVEEVAMAIDSSYKKKVLQNSFQLNELAEVDYGYDEKENIEVPIVQMNAKKRGVNSSKITVSNMLLPNIDNPEDNVVMFEINGSIPTNIAGEGDYILCTKCSSVELNNGDKIFENGRNAKFFKYFRNGDIIMLTNDDNSKESVIIKDEKELENYYKILLAISRH